MNWLACALALTLLAAPLGTEAQPAGKVARIGILCGVKCEGPSYDALREGLRELGWTEGRTLVVELRGAEGQRQRLPALAAELVALKVDLIVAVAPEPNRAAKTATSTIPIVMIGVADPVAVGLAESLARPGGNLTGRASACAASARPPPRRRPGPAVRGSRASACTADVAVPACRCDRLEHLVRYLVRPSLTLARLTESADGQLLYQFRRPWTHGVTVGSPGVAGALGLRTGLNSAQPRHDDRPNDWRPRLGRQIIGSRQHRP